MSPVAKLQDILNRARITDDEIRGGVEISDGGLQKVAARLGTDVSEVKTLLATLIQNLRDEHETDVSTFVEETECQYAYESDFMGNLTIRDSRAGEEHYVGGSEAAHLLLALRSTKPDSPEEQALLQQACGTEEPLQEDDESEVGGSFMPELNNDAGSYNFPWRAGQHNGTATAAYRATDKAFDLEIIDIRDNRGEEMKASPKLTAEVEKQARAFIGKE